MGRVGQFFLLGRAGGRGMSHKDELLPMSVFYLLVMVTGLSGVQFGL